jgi:hypothetical protein
MDEVHRWRGSPEGRARLAPPRDLGRFAYFDEQLGHPDWRGKRVLDFGGNDGNLCLHPGCPIAEEDYTCIALTRFRGSRTPRAAAQNARALLDKLKKSKDPVIASLARERLERLADLEEYCRERGPRVP